MNDLLIRRASVAPGTLIDLHVRSGVITDGPDDGFDVTIDVGGRPVLPGLHDHHIHLMATAAAERSVACDPDTLARHGGLVSHLRHVRKETPHGMMRAVGYDLTQSGWIDRRELDNAKIGPVRVQDRTGMLWILDSAALNAILPPERTSWPEGIQTDAAGRPTGRLYRLDDWLRSRLPTSESPDLSSLGRRLASRGVTAVTDATSTNGVSEAQLLARAGLPQRVHMMTKEPSVHAVSGVTLDAVKVVFDDDALPSIDELQRLFAATHSEGRRVAVHCVSEIQLAVALAAGLGRGDRLEHATFVRAEALSAIAARGIIVAVHPSLIRLRGDRYRAETPPIDLPHVHRIASLRQAGIPLLGSSDAPYGDVDPWNSILSAHARRTASGADFGTNERLSHQEALALFSSYIDDNQLVKVRRITVGQPADLVIMDSDWPDIFRDPDVYLTTVAGQIVHAKDTGGSR